MSELLKKVSKLHKEMTEIIGDKETLSVDDVEKIHSLVTETYGDVKVTSSELIDSLYPKIMMEKLPEGINNLYDEINSLKARIHEIKNTINKASRNLEVLPNATELMDEYKEAKQTLRTLVFMTNFRYGRIQMEEKRVADHERVNMLREGLKEILNIVDDPYRLPTDQEWNEIREKTNALIDKVYPQGVPEFELTPFLYKPKTTDEPKRYQKVVELNILEGPGESRTIESDYPFVLRGKPINTNDPKWTHLKNRKEDDE